MARFDDIHHKAMRPGRAMMPGDIWCVAVREPVTISLKAPLLSQATVTVAEFRCERHGDGNLVLRATPETAELIADWNRRHVHTPESVFGLPDGIFR